MNKPILQSRPLTIGAPVPRADAAAKVTGREKYAADYYGDGFLWAGVRRAGIAHGGIRRISIQKAAGLAGVVRILTSRDVKGTNRYGVVETDQPVLADDRVRHIGDPVVLVIAEEKEILEQALGLIDIDYDPLPAVFDPIAALRDDAVRIHANRADGNLLLKGRIRKGDDPDIWGQCDQMVDAEFSFPHQEHACLETECGWARVGDDGILDIVVSTQTPFRDRVELSHALGIEIEKMRIIAPYCGGAFGGKDGITVQALLALAALNCPGRAVKLWCSREESILASPKRHPARLRYRLGARSDGTFMALAVDAWYDTGPYDHLGVVVMTLGLEHAGGPYRIPHTDLKARAVYTNNPVGGPFRGFGVPQVAGAMEQVVDMMAARLGMSPLELRLKNSLDKGDVNPVGATLSSSTGIRRCLETLRQHPLWQEKAAWKSGAGPFQKRGVGIAAVMQGMGYGPVVPDVADAKIELTGDGRFIVYAGVVDMGQGNASTYLQMAGSILNQDSGRMALVLPDTDRTLPSGSASASRTTYTFGNALIGAARILKEKILARAAECLDLEDNGGLKLEPGQVRHGPDGRTIGLAGLLPETERVVTHRFQAPVADTKVDCDEKIRSFGVPHRIFSYAAHLAYVEIDRLTGRVRVQRYLAVTDCGRIVNPQLFEQQMHGGIAQGLGYALYEDLIVNQGRIEAGDFSTYILPGSLDIPEMETAWTDEEEESGPFGLKGAGEIAMNGPLPAVANAVADACGRRIYSSPLTWEKALRAMEADEKGETTGEN